MKLSIFSRGFLMMLIACAFLVTPNLSHAQYQSSLTPKYVKATNFDTVKLSGSTSIRRTVIVTNESATLQLIVYLSRKDGTRDTTAYFRVPPGKTLKASFVGTKVYRKAVTGTDSVYSQVLEGDVSLSYYDEQINIAGDMWCAVTSSINKNDSEILHVPYYVYKVHKPDKVKWRIDLIETKTLTFNKRQFQKLKYV